MTTSSDERPAEAVERLGHPGPDHVAELLDGAGTERRLQEATQPVVVGVVAEHERVGVAAGPGHASQLGVDQRVASGVGGLDADAGVAQDRVDVGVAGEHPPVQQLGAVHGIVGPQLGVLLVGRLDEPGLERVERCGHHNLPVALASR